MVLLAGLVLVLGPGRDFACLASDDADIQRVQSPLALEADFVPADTADWQSVAAEEHSSYGYSVATVGNVDNHGGDDVLVGAPKDDSQGGGGAVYLFLSDIWGDLETTAAWAVGGGDDAVNFGSSVAGAGNVNDDDFDDFIVADEDYKAYLEVRPGEWNWTQAGGAFVYTGNTEAELSEVPIWSYTGEVQTGKFACAVAGAGDLNDDGFDDIVVGARLYTDRTDDTENGEGAVYVFYGSAEGPNTEPNWLIDGDQAGAALGTAVSAAGDVSGDGIDDLIVGAPKYVNPETGLREGAVFVFRGGSPSASVVDAAWVVYGGQEGAEFGSRVAGVGDVNGDGFRDVLVSAPLYRRPSDGALVGAVFAYCGNGAGLDSDPCWSVHGDQPGGGFGASIGAAGNVNGDLYDDVIIGAPTYEEPDPETGFLGAAFIYFGSDEGLSLWAGWKASGDKNRTDFGFSVGSAGDFDGDGVDGVIIGAPKYFRLGTAYGAAFAFYGPLEPAPLYRSSLPVILRNSD